MNALKGMTKEQKAEFDKALESIATGDYKGTAIKVELEAQLNRPYDDDREDNCSNCDGEGYNYCQACEEEGEVTCSQCDGDGEISNPAFDALSESDQETADIPQFLDCETCAGEGVVNCSTCEGDARNLCSVCEGTGAYTGDDAPDSFGVDRTNYESGRPIPGGCHRFILKHVPQAAADALIYAKFYNDGSVDSEYTFTLPLDKAHMAVHFIEAFNELAKAVNKKGPNTEGAGMHIAILNSRNGDYPRGNSFNDAKAHHFVNAMTPLLPALYFLASATHKSRGLRYRPPQIDLYSKYAAISGENGCFEYRIFETCYERPLAFIDFVIVIAKSLQFFKSTATATSGNIGTLRLKDGTGIDRFFFSEKHMDALENGLKWLKPDYKTIAELGKERNFSVGKDAMRANELKRVDQWKEEFIEVKKRRHFERLRLYHAGLAEGYQKLRSGEEVDPKVYARDRLKRLVNETQRQLKGDVKDYVKQKASEYERNANSDTGSSYAIGC